MEHPPPLAWVPADYAQNSDQERLAMEMLTYESELEREAEIVREQAERQGAIALVKARVGIEREERAANVVKLEE
jgi:hypothetical protein